MIRSRVDGSGPVRIRAGRPGVPSVDSLATRLRSLGDPRITYPLRPPLTHGCPQTSTAGLAYPVDIDYDRMPAEPFTGRHGAGLDRWAPLLPPLPAPG